MTKLINTPIGKKFPEKKEILNEITMHDLDYDYEIGFNQCLEIVSNLEVAEGLERIDEEKVDKVLLEAGVTGDTTRRCLVLALCDKFGTPKVEVKKIDFEQFLSEKHAEQYTGPKHCMVDDCADWIENLSPDEFIEYGNLYIKKSLEA